MFSLRGKWSYRGIGNIVLYESHRFHSGDICLELKEGFLRVKAGPFLEFTYGTISAMVKEWEVEPWVEKALRDYAIDMAQKYLEICE